MTLLKGNILFITKHLFIIIGMFIVQTFYLNIDGNATNFDHFVAEQQLYNHTFSVISVCDTNIEQCDQNMYPIDNYNSIYQSKKCDKSKGSGIGMYIHKKYNFSKIERY